MLKNKCALITGSTSGIGLGIAKSLAAEGCNIVLNGFGPAEEIEKIRSSLASEFSVKAHYSDADMSKPDQIRAMIGEADSLFGGVDILVNNAGIQNVAPIDEFADEKCDAIIAINLSSNFHTTKAVLPLMKKKNWGRIINLASVHGMVASPFKSAYVAAKHGVLGLTKTTALEVVDFNITCNAICPGYVLTPLVEGQIDQQAKAHHLPREKVISDVILASQPKKSFVEVEALGALAVFLCSDAASSMTGATLPVDGAWTAR